MHNRGTDAGCLAMKPRAEGGVVDGRLNVFGQCPDLRTFVELRSDLRTTH